MRNFSEKNFKRETGVNPVQCRCCMEGVCFQNATENIGKVEAYRDFRARIPACMYFLKLRAMAGEMLRFYFTGEMAPHIYAEFYFVRAH